MASTGYSQLYLNEWMAANDGSLADENGEYDDWIEIYNAGPAAVNLAGYYLSDKANNPTLWAIPGTQPWLTTLAPGGYLLLWADEQPEQGPLHLNFKLSAGGERLSLYAPDGATAIDVQTFGPQADNISYGRTVDGGPDFQSFPLPSPGNSNSLSNPGFYSVNTVYKPLSATDDAEETAGSGVVALYSSDLELIRDGGADQLVGIRFPGIDLPEEAVISRAYLEFTVDEPTSIPTFLIIQTQQAPNPFGFQTNTGNLSTRPRSPGSVTWQPESWLMPGQVQRSPDVKLLVQGLLNQPGWQPGQAMVFFLSGSGTRVAQAFDANPAWAPRLVIEARLPAPAAPISGLYFNELAANGSQYTDEQGEVEDWIELHNANSSPVPLGGLYLTDDPNHLLKWVIGTPIELASGGFQLLVADDEPSEGALHFPFKLSSEGEYLALVQWLDGQAVVIDELNFPAIPFQAAYARQPNASANWLLVGDPTPASSNNNARLWLAPPSLSLPSGWYQNPQIAAFSHPEPGVSIRYTLNGSDPDAQSALYTVPITIGSTRTIRARAFKTGYTPSQPTTAAYVLQPLHSLPIVTITTDPDNIWDNFTGIYPVGLNGAPGYCSDELRNFCQPWERPATVTLFEPNGQTAFQVNAGIQIGGGCSRNFPQKALNIYLRNNLYGDDKIDYPIFSNRSFTSYYRLKLRNSGNDFLLTHYRDALIHALLFDRVDLDLLSYRPAILYLNGAYWGIFNLREHLNNDYLAANHPEIDPNNLDLLKNPDVAWGEIKDGDDLAYRQLHSYLQNNRLHTEPKYNQVANQLDINQTLNYLITQLYIGNGDWPANNMALWRERKADAKWRFILFDTDFAANANYTGGTSAPNFNFIQFALDSTSFEWPNSQASHLLFRRLLEYQPFRHEFIQRSATFAALIFQSTRVNAFSDSLQSAIAPYMANHILRWSGAAGGSYSSWQSNVVTMKQFFVQRPGFFRTHLNSYFQLSGYYNLSIPLTAASGGDVYLHWNEMKMPYQYQATYFKNIPIRAKAVPKPGFVFVRWLETGQTEPVIDFTSSANTTLTPIFQAGITAVEEPHTPEVQVFPNPGDGQFFILIPDAAASTSLYIRVYSTAGLLVQEHRLPYTPQQAAKLDLRTLATGLYFLDIQYSGGQVHQRVLID